MTVILDSNELTKTLKRLAHEVIENYVDLSSLVLVGIVTRGEQLAKRLQDTIYEIEKIKVPYGYINVAFIQG